MPFALSNLKRCSTFWLPRTDALHPACFQLSKWRRVSSESSDTSSSRDASKKAASETPHGQIATKHWTEAGIGDQHWLDRRLPGLREWLESKNKNLWLKGIRERCRQHANLMGKEDFLEEQLSKRYSEYLQRYSHMVVDERAKTHLQMCALMLATKHVLSPWIKDIRTVEDIIRAHMGDFTSPVLRFLLRYVLYLSRDPYLSTTRRLKGLRLDYGKGFATEINQSQRSAELRIDNCFYHEILHAENAEHLLSACCCSQDRIWFEKLDSHGIGFERKGWKGSGDSHCLLRIESNRES